MTTILAGDVGATKTALELFSTEAGPRSPLAQGEFPSPSYPSLVAMVRDFLSQTQTTVSSHVSALPVR